METLIIAFIIIFLVSFLMACTFDFVDLIKLGFILIFIAVIFIK